MLPSQEKWARDLEALLPPSDSFLGSSATFTLQLQYYGCLPLQHKWVLTLLLLLLSQGMCL